MRCRLLVRVLLLAVLAVASCACVPEGVPTTPAPMVSATPAATAVPEECTLFRSDRYGVQLCYPPDWQQVQGYGGPRFEGDDGFLQLDAAVGENASLDAVTLNAIEHKLTPYGSEPTIEHLQIAGQPARLVLPSEDQPEEMAGQALLLISYPRPVIIEGRAYEFLTLYADRDHIREIGASIVFLPVSEPVASTTPSAEGLAAEAQALVADLADAVSATWKGPEEGSFTWQVPEAGGELEPMRIRGYKVVGEGASSEGYQEVIAYLVEQGFEAEPHNVSEEAVGYIREGLACLVSDGASGDDGYLVQVCCGPLTEEAGEAVASVVEANTLFGLELYHLIGEERGNIFFSPYSIFQALAMVYEGARGETAAQMAQALHLSPDGAPLGRALYDLATELDSRGQGISPEEGTGFILRVANALWGQESYSFTAEFVEALQTYYHAALQRVDFSKPEEARLTINRWISENTEGKIEDLIPPGALDEATRLVLTNAIYFNASWLYQFNEGLTSEGTFFPAEGREVTVPLMQTTANMQHYVTEDLTVVEMPYVGNEVVMTILMPRKGYLAEFEKGLDAETLNKALEGLAQGRVRLRMPKFKVESSFNLSDALRAMGIVDAFSYGSADFSGMDGTRELFIQAALHKAYVQVDEAGTEAAAATAVAVGTTAMPSPPVEITLDHPFIFIIRDRPTNAVLFWGRLENPAA